MDIAKRFYLFALLLLVSVGLLVFTQKAPKRVGKEDRSLKNQILNESLQNVIKGTDAISDGFSGQIPESSLTDKYRAVKTEEKKQFNRKHQALINSGQIELNEEANQTIVNERNARIKSVEETLSNMKSKIPPLPEGFFSAKASPYIMYRENYPMSQDFKSLMLDMHSSFVKNATPFSILTEIERIFLMMFNNKENYSLYAKRPEWSGAMTNIYDQSIYIIENKSFKSSLMHELTHIYFDGFFTPARAPRWLSEGFAVYVQTLYQTPQENRWLDEYRLKFAGEEYIDFKEFTTVPDLSNYNREDVEMWYAQSYSVVRFLFEHYGKDDFYQFSKNLKEGMPLGKALYRSFGMPLNSTSALESAWQANLKKNIKGKYL